MSRYADAPLHKITMNIYKADYELFVRHYGQGWSEVVRAVLKTHAAEIRREIDNKRNWENRHE